MGLFDSPTHLLIILVVLVVLFGSAKLPKAAKSMGEAMRIFKKESAKMHEEDAATSQTEAWEPPPPQVTAPPQATAPQPQVTAPQPQVAPQQATTQDQMAALQRQMDALQQQMATPEPPAPGTAAPGGTLPETQHTNQPG
jgi:sec-independent protein translocase protein TatA